MGTRPGLAGAAAAALLLLSPGGGKAQEPLAVIGPPARAVEGLTAAESATFFAQIDRVVAILRANPALAERAEADCLELLVDPPRRAGTVPQVRLRLQGRKREGSACSGEPQPGISVWLNDPVAFYPAEGVIGLEKEALGDERGRFYLTPLPERRPPTPLFPSYRGAVYIARPDVEPWVIVTKEEHLRALQGLWRRAVARARAEGRTRVHDSIAMGYFFDPPLPERIMADIDRELAQLDGKARSLPACWPNNGKIRPWLLSTGGAQPCGIERQFVRLNPAFLDAPPEAGKLVSVVVSNKDGLMIGFDRTWAEWTRRFMQALDYAALGELVGR